MNVIAPVTPFALNIAVATRGDRDKMSPHDGEVAPDVLSERERFTTEFSALSLATGRFKSWKSERDTLFLNRRGPFFSVKFPTGQAS